jgi:hypothetical protein
MPSGNGLQGGLYSSPLLSAPSPLLSAPAGAAAVGPAVGRDVRRAEYMTPQTYSTLEGSGDGALGGGSVGDRRGATEVAALKSERDVSPGRLFLFFWWFFLVPPLLWFTLSKNNKHFCLEIYIYIYIH